MSDHRRFFVRRDSDEIAKLRAMLEASAIAHARAERAASMWREDCLEWAVLGKRAGCVIERQHWMIIWLALGLVTSWALVGLVAAIVVRG